jgi:ElaB/YqjD/DUF883 family membrane-anchored ribosome-binding protein
MTPPSFESATTGLAAIRSHASDAMRQAAHVAEEARLLQTIAVDAFEDIRRVTHLSLQSVKAVSERASELRNELTDRIRERPLTALAITLGVGVSLGILYAHARPARPRQVNAA